MLALPFGDYRDTEQLCCDVISGGLNGGALTKIVTGALILNIFLSLVDLAESIGLIITSMAGLIATAPLGTMIIAAALVVVGIACSVFAVIEIGKSLWLYYRYINGDKDAGLDLIENTAYNLLFTLLFVVGSSAAKHFLKNSVKKALYSIMGSDFVENMLKEFDDIFALKKCVKQLQDMGFSVGVIIELSDAFGKKGLDWLLSKKGLGLTDDLVRKIIKAGNLDWFTDDVMRAIINSNGYADDIIDLIKKYGKDAADAIGKYGDDAVEVFKKYGDDAVDGFKNGKTPDEIKADMDNVDSGGGSSSVGDTDTGGGTTGGDNGGAGSGTESGSGSVKYSSWDEMKNAYDGTITKFINENKPKYSPDVKKWFDNGGTIEIGNVDGKQVWTYTTATGESVPYIDGYIQFPDEYLNPVIKSIDIGEFTGDRSKDIDKMLEILEADYGITEIPDGYVVHHDIAVS